ncbi:hypothetical protein [Pseudoponticoccus marisrubri]|uniref:Uncharacterized protein n=1 Tax=Pseudoponticoccus marisrubri TaxID=1685382 RepID=A0A0W7WMR9_9RHOB|nr:hypothetical protein [Pseudoponticoccus marisrubri]KUF11855.1 hypothetical protein AVJ23_04540 [Pseudoponticoccus marisrubri]
MRFSHRVSPRDNLLAVRFAGIYRPTRSIEAARAAMQDPLFQPDMAQIFDLAGVDRFDADYRAVVELVGQKARLYRDLPAGLTYVLLAPGFESYGMARMYQQLAEGHFPFAVQVARDRTEAAACLHMAEARLGALLDAG